MRAYLLRGNGECAPLVAQPFEREAHLEDLVEKHPEILLGERMLVIKRQVDAGEAGRLDLLALDAGGNAVVVELKKSVAPRETHSQASEYISWLKDQRDGEIMDLAAKYFQEPRGKLPLVRRFCETFGTDEMPRLNQRPRVVLVAEVFDKKTLEMLRTIRADIKCVEVHRYGGAGESGTFVVCCEVLVGERAASTFREAGRQETLEEKGGKARFVSKLDKPTLRQKMKEYLRKELKQELVDVRGTKQLLETQDGRVAIWYSLSKPYSTGYWFGIQDQHIQFLEKHSSGYVACYCVGDGMVLLPWGEFKEWMPRLRRTETTHNTHVSFRKKDGQLKLVLQGGASVSVMKWLRPF